ncbi:MAG: TetR/AcrR family transcriptional regulator [Acidobacteriota bacterium]|nr:TetR/AcrR family transcriptional regulator [Acidobacteriota bacterium]
MARPRTIADEDILMALHAVVGRIGPTRMTLADVAAEVGLSPATLVQRFGSKRGLLLAFAKAGAESADYCFAAVRAAHESPLAALIAAATMMTRSMGSPEELANGLAFLQIDISDREFRKHALVSFEKSAKGYKSLLDDAVEAGELLPCDTTKLAHAVGAISGGSLIAWAVLQKGTAERWVRRDLETLLAPYRAKPGAKKEPKRRENVPLNDRL